MILTLVELKKLLAALDEARRQAVEGSPLYCTVAHTDAEGRTYRVESKPRARHGPSSVEVSLGVHGRAFLGVDPETGEVCCAKCQGVV